MGVGEGAPGGGWGGSVISGSRWEIITSTTRAQITFCGIESLTAKCLLKVIEAEGRGQEEGGGVCSRASTLGAFQSLTFSGVLKTVTSWYLLHAPTTNAVKALSLWDLV